MADRELSQRQYIKRIKQHKILRQDPLLRQRKEKSKRERERVLEEQDAEMQIKEYLK